MSNHTNTKLSQRMDKEMSKSNLSHQKKSPESITDLIIYQGGKGRRRERKRVDQASQHYRFRQAQNIHRMSTSGQGMYKNHLLTAYLLCTKRVTNRPLFNRDHAGLFWFI